MTLLYEGWVSHIIIIIKLICSLLSFHLNNLVSLTIVIIQLICLSSERPCCMVGPSQYNTANILIAIISSERPCCIGGWGGFLTIIIIMIVIIIHWDSHNPHHGGVGVAWVSHNYHHYHTTNMFIAIISSSWGVRVGL